MLKEKLNQLCCLALDGLMSGLMSALFNLRALIMLNPRMTARGCVGGLVILCAHFGLHISAENQTMLAFLITLYLGIAGRDKQIRRIS